MKKAFIIMVAVVIALRNGRRAKFELASETGYSEEHIRELCVALRKAGIITVINGTGGGYELAVPFHKITLGDINNAIRQDSIPPRVDWIARKISYELLSVYVSDLI